MVFSGLAAPDQRPLRIQNLSDTRQVAQSFTEPLNMTEANSIITSAIRNYHCPPHGSEPSHWPHDCRCRRSRRRTKVSVSVLGPVGGKSHPGEERERRPRCNTI